MLNQVTLIGNIGNAPEIRSTQAGRSVANASLATSERWTDNDGNRQEHTEWHDLRVWGKRAETFAEIVSRGRQICVQGRLRTDQWHDRKTGEKRSKKVIVVDSFHLLGKRPDTQDAPAGAGAGADEVDPF